MLWAVKFGYGTNGVGFCPVHGQTGTSIFPRFLCGSLSDPEKGRTLQAGADWYFQLELLEINPYWSRRVNLKWIIIRPSCSMHPVLMGGERAHGNKELLLHHGDVSSIPGPLWDGGSARRFGAVYCAGWGGEGGTGSSGSLGLSLSPLFCVWSELMVWPPNLSSDQRVLLK